MAVIHWPTLEWLAMEGARIYVNNSVRGAMPQPFRVQTEPTRFSEVICSHYPPAEPVVLTVDAEWFAMTLREAGERLRLAILPILRERRDYKCSVRHRVLASMRVLNMHIPDERPKHGATY